MPIAAAAAAAAIDGGGTYIMNPWMEELFRRRATPPPPSRKTMTAIQRWTVFPMSERAREWRDYDDLDCLCLFHLFFLYFIENFCFRLWFRFRYTSFLTLRTWWRDVPLLLSPRENRQEKKTRNKFACLKFSSWFLHANVEWCSSLNLKSELSIMVKFSCCRTIVHALHSLRYYYYYYYCSCMRG